MNPYFNLRKLFVGILLITSSAVYANFEPTTIADVELINIDSSSGSIVKASNGCVYIVDGYCADRLDIFDIKNRSILSSVKINSYTNMMAINGNFVYTLGVYGRFQIIDVQDPKKPTIKNDKIGFKEPAAMAIHNNHAYIVEWDLGISYLNVVDVSNPEKPNSVCRIVSDPEKNKAEYKAESGPLAITIYNDHAFVITDNKICIFDIKNPEQPEYVMKIINIGKPTAVAIYNGCAFVIANTDLYIINVKNPKEPKVMTKIDGMGNLTTVEIYGCFACLTNTDKQLFLVDETYCDKKNTYPKAVLKIDRRINGMPMAIDDGYAYIKTDSALQIVKIGNLKEELEQEIMSVLSPITQQLKNETMKLQQSKDEIKNLRLLKNQLSEPEAKQDKKENLDKAKILRTIRRMK